MNFQFSEEQEELRRQAQRLLSDSLARARRILESGEAVDAALWGRMVEMGWPAAGIPEEQGGLGLGGLELCVLAEEVGRGLAPTPFVSSVLHATEALKIAGGPAADAWLPLLASGERVATVAFTEGGAGSWDAAPAATVRGGRLTGTKTPVADGLAADVVLVSARDPEDGGGFGWWLVDLRGDGVERTALTAIDRVRKHAALRFDAAPALRLGEAGQGATLARRAMDVAAVLTAFEQLGGAETALAMSVEYAKTRKTFGSLIGVNQAVKHRLADMYTKIQLARGHAYYGAWALAAGAAELPVAAAGARLAATDALGFAAEEAVELHGGIGFTWESDCQLFYRRARLLALGLGNRERWTDRLVTALAARNPA